MDYLEIKSPKREYVIYEKIRRGDFLDIQKSRMGDLIIKVNPREEFLKIHVQGQKRILYKLRKSKMGYVEIHRPKKGIQEGVLWK